jgi:diguanylate cyclase (GGDEF)-like protein
MRNNFNVMGRRIMTLRTKLVVFVSLSITGVILIYFGLLYLVNSKPFAANDIENSLAIAFICVALFSVATLIKTKPYLEEIDYIIQMINNIKGNEKVVPRVNRNSETDTIVQGLVELSKELDRRKSKLMDIAYKDQITRLPNRAALFQYLDELYKNPDNEVTILFMNVQKFKRVNSVRGYKVGDIILKSLAERLINLDIEGINFISRVGNNEFVIVSKGTKDKEYITDLVEEIKKEITIPIVLQHQSYHVDIELGVSFGHQDKEPVLTVAEAEVACRNKEENIFFEKAIKEESALEIDIETYLRKSLGNNEMSVVFQPIVNSKGNSLKAETLLRWNNPTLGQVSPAEFISVAEEIGVIKDLTEFVIKEALEFYSFMRDKNNLLQHVSVNISPVILNQSAWLIGTLETIQEKYEVSSQDIVLEITEGILLSRQNFKLINELNQKGYKISIDDFGTGYSSFSYLAEMPIDLLKIDRSLTNLITHDEEEIVKVLVQFAKSAGIDVVAEGVETEQQFKYLKKIGATWLQGYYLTKPLDKKSFFEYVENFKHKKADQLSG